MDKELLEQCRNNPRSVHWFDISTKQILSEDFIREFKDKIDWVYISRNQILSEDFIREFKDKVDWYWISAYQILSEDFIREFKDKVDWDWISIDQALSEDFIREFKDRVHWGWISECQTLSEDFIREFKNKVAWYCISKYQTLSEDFIREFKDKVYWDCISTYQVLSEDFIREFDIKIPESSWLYKTPEDKLKEAKKVGYKIRKGKIVAYKSVKKNMTSVYKPEMVYEIGKYYKTHCDCLANNSNSFGLSAWTKEGALKYHSIGKLLEVEIDPSDLGVIVHDNKKIRCFGMKIVREINE